MLSWEAGKCHISVADVASLRPKAYFCEIRVLAGTCHSSVADVASLRHCYLGGVMLLLTLLSRRCHAVADVVI